MKNELAILSDCAFRRNQFTSAAREKRTAYVGGKSVDLGEWTCITVTQSGNGQHKIWTKHTLAEVLEAVAGEGDGNE